MPSVSVRQLIQEAKSRKNNDQDRKCETSFGQKPQRSPLVDRQLIRRNVLTNQEGLGRFEVPGSPRGVYVIDDIVLPEVAAELAHAIQALPHYKELRGARRTLPLRIGAGEGAGLIDHLVEELLASLPQLAELFGDEPALNHALVNDYESGCGGIMPHTDGPAYFPVVMIVCLVSATVMQFGKTPDDVETQVLLPARSLLIFTGEAYNDYLHSIPFHDTPIEQLPTKRRDLGESVIVDGLLHRGPRLSVTIRRALVPFEQLAHSK
ncbi:Alpha-ketoglutarate-dependent dioxygenase alkB 6 [Perkinsus chesapeaki]|uniref:Alpha-ketoglutarate-dependent dioxygenase alkB 6 n=1 Tax=Perkinsus chesapeaki TaxID=330153 RepID=A0A7J6LUA2_PERCH|nr:Alpha-ketoglutarate-dependent dioxygenase alkB 6 [Perkinsus chesapeaki]